MPIALRARVVYPVDCPAIEHGVITIDGERIVGVGAAAEIGIAVQDLGHVALLPGFVNAHTHLEFSDLTRPLGQRGMSPADWIRHVLSHRRNNARYVTAAIAAGCRESLLCGVTTIGEIATADPSAYASAPLIDLTAFVEVIGFSRARAESALQAGIDQTSAFERASNDTMRLGLSPHAPYTVSPGLLRRLVDTARDRQIPVAMHIAESADELELLDRGTGRFQQLLEERSMWDATVIPRGSTPFDYLQMLAVAPRALVIHGNYLDRDEHEFLATQSDRMSLVYCPRTHTYSDHPPYPLPELLAAGVRVALGTDSRASNPDLSLAAEMRHISQMHPDVAPDAILRMGTLSGAEALGAQQECGSITAGKLANLTAIPLSPGAKEAPSAILDEILASSAQPSGVWYRGCEVRTGEIH
jgi:cytosine/adenosine deaminase-related metal-dependent hydrolase